ncbi:hypothetical protein MNBD_GAMMA05-608 [hydrothermal vent metagenome]|uniref:Uncharacterized protein n=1 Tax=hydrothermal vent metagenome TaxID=652676 RepID=A0A3B0X5P8_9ZZZZ
MNLKKSAIAAAVVAVVGAPTIASADTISMTFTGAFTLIGGTGGVNPNGDSIVPGLFDGSSGFDGIGSRTPVSGTATFDTTTGAGSATISEFSFFGNGLASATTVSFQAIGDGMGGSAGTLVAGVMGFNWNGSFQIPVTLIFDAAGFFTSAAGTVSGDSWTVGAGCLNCATSATPNTLFGSAIGAVPMAMTGFDTAGTTLGSLFPLSDTGGIAGSPMTTAPFPGQNAAFDFTSISATNTTVPVPAAAWLFGSGLLGLVGVARRRRQS